MATLSSNKIKFIRSLSQKKFRDQYGLFIAEGEKIVDEALKSGFKVREIYLESEIGNETMARISNLSSPSPILAVIEKPEYGDSLLAEAISKCRSYLDSQECGSRKAPLYLALDGVKDPGNLGTIIRVADWFGIDAIFASHGSVEVYNPKVVQATMGAIFRKRVIYANLEEVCLKFKAAGVPLYGTFLDGDSIYGLKYRETPLDNGVIVMGSESFGISDNLSKIIDNHLLIPPYPADATTSESLNVAIATAIICAEFRRL